MQHAFPNALWLRQRALYFYIAIALTVLALFTLLPQRVLAAVNAIPTTQGIAVSAAPSYNLPIKGSVSVQTNQSQTVITLHLDIAKEYYVYANNSDTPKPATVQLFGPNKEPLAFTATFPEGVWRQDVFDSQKRVLAYEGAFSVTLALDQKLDDSTAQNIAVGFDGLLCSPVNCVPVAQVYFADHRPSTALRSFSHKAAIPLLPALALSTASTPLANAMPNFTPRYFQAHLEPQGLGMALVLGLLAGLILNIMPCVLPVLTIKISGLLHASGHHAPAERMKTFREHNLLFAAGVLTWFFCLAFLISVFGLAWGSLFQNDIVVYALLLLVFVLALSLFDVFTLPLVDFKVNATASPRVQAYFSGCIATFLATPCSGPLLGGVLGWVALQSPAIAFLVFLATGIGMALPYLLLALFPNVARFFPKPGPWTTVMERLVGFFLLGTCVYLLSILPDSMQISSIITLLIAALAAWVWGQWGALHISLGRRLTARMFAVALVVGAVWWSFIPTQSLVWRSFEAKSFYANLGKRTVLVEFTADWCPSCKALEHTVLTPATLEPLIQEYDLELIRVDLTRAHAEGEALQQALQSVSLPLTAIFPKGENAHAPLVLRDLYTSNQLRQALQTLGTP